MSENQHKQAVLLYYFTSPVYLKELYEKVRLFKQSAEGTLQKSKKEGRDRYLRSGQWGDRDTSENWSNNAWALIADPELSISRQISDMASEVYYTTGVSHCGRGMAEYSLMWTTPDWQWDLEQ